MNIFRQYLQEKISEGFEKKAIGCYIHLSIFSFGKLCKIDHYMHTHALLKLLLLYSTCSINIEQAKIIDNVFLLVVLGSYSPCKCNIYKFCNNYKIIILFSKLRGGTSGNLLCVSCYYYIHLSFLGQVYINIQ